MAAVRNTNNQQKEKTINGLIDGKNAVFPEQGEDLTLIGLISEGISEFESEDNILAFTLEQIAKIKQLSFCAFLELNDQNAILLSYFINIPTKDSVKNQVSLSKELFEKITSDPLLLSGDDLLSQRVSISFNENPFLPKTVLILPFSTRQIPNGTLIIADTLLSREDLHLQIEPISRVIKIVCHRMDSLFLLQELKHQNEALRRSENTLSSIFRAAPTGIGLVSDRILLEVNQRICEMTGYTQEELVGKNARILYPSDADYQYVGREKYRLIQEFGTGTVETRWQRKDGQIIDVLMSSTPIDPNNLDIGVTFTALDITDRKTAETRLQSQLQRLAALNQIDAAITSNLSLDHTIDILLEQSVRQLNIDAAAVFTYKPSTHSLEFFASYGFSQNYILTGSTRLGQKYSGRVALERRTIMASIEDEDFLTNTKVFANEGFQSYCGIPLITKGQVKGVLEVFDRGLLSANEDWLNFLETLAGQAAIAIDNAEMVGNLERSNLELRLAYNTTLEGWARALELRDFETRGHSQNVTELTIQLARAVGMPEEALVHIQRGALLHDIGKMGIPDHILLKNGPLDEDEWEIMRQHPLHAYEMLSEIEFLRPALDIPHYHHERWDGSGYPYGLKGESIPLAARVFTVVDVWDALSSIRPYRAAWSKEAVLNYILEGSGTYFDPRVVDAFMRIIDTA